MSSIQVIPQQSSGGTVTSVSGTLNRIVVTSGTTDAVVDISPNYVGQTSITTLGTITTGTWQGTAVGATFGGTGQTTYATGDMIYASATNTLSKRSIGSENQFFKVVSGVPTWSDLSDFEGTGQTIGETTDDLITIPLGSVAGTFQFEARVKGYDPSTPSGCGYNIYSTFTTNGISASLVGNQSIFNENGVLVDADAYFVASGNNAVLQVLGVSGLTIDWDAETDLT